jgi:hypothetical protein
MMASGLLGSNQPIHLDVLKLPHHGSDRNSDASFFERVSADHYVVSADGIKHHHPSDDTLRWLVQSRNPGERYSIHLTNEIPYAVVILDELRDGRNFTVTVRRTAEPAVVVTLPD